MHPEQADNETFLERHIRMSLVEENMTNREIQLFVIAVQLPKQLSRACPDVGIGPSDRKLADFINNRLTEPLIDAVVEDSSKLVGDCRD